MLVSAGPELPKPTTKEVIVPAPGVFGTEGVFVTVTTYEPAPMGASVTVN